jgi:hypothetical protein
MTDTFCALLRQTLNVKAVKEYQFHPTRKWRFDYAIVEHFIAIEVEGGVWAGGRHTRGKGFINDIEKYNTATSIGWRLFRVTPQQLLTMQTIEYIRPLIYQEK